MRDLDRTGRTVSVNLNQTDDGPDRVARVLTLLDEARARVPIVAQAAGRSIGILHVPRRLPAPADVPSCVPRDRRLPMGERLVALRDPDRQRRFVDEVPGDDLYRKAVTERFARMYPVADGAIDYEPTADHSVASLAAAQGRPPMQLVLDQLLAHDGNGMLYLPFFNYAYGDLSFSYELHATLARGWGSATPVPTAARSATAARPRSCSRTGSTTAAGGRASRSNTSCIARPGRPPSCTGCSTGG